ncbi:MAG: hypothetical protein JRN54_06655 [Nitrososphaerota archaeon]|nr:hypothetical protein [Nitrososphaerota archaeon]
MKNQSYHRHRTRIQGSPELDFRQLRDRTVNALNNLGRQKFSDEPGGYSLESWARGVGVLLDEFEEKAGKENLSHEYHAGRQELNRLVSEPVPLASLDEGISELRATVSAMESMMAAESGRVAAKITELKAERARRSSELDAEKAHAASAANAQKTDSLFSRLLGRKRHPNDDRDSKVRELEARQSDLSAELLAQQRLLKEIDYRPPGSPFAKAREELEAAQTRLEELENERMERANLVNERARVTASLAEAISAIPHGGAGTV